MHEPVDGGHVGNGVAVRQGRAERGVWRRNNGRADIENRIKELGAQFGLRGFCLRSFWATEAACQLCLLAYNLCVGCLTPPRRRPPSRAQDPPIPALLLCRRLQPRPRQTHPKTRLRHTGRTPLVARSPSALCRQRPQPRCS